VHALALLNKRFRLALRDTVWSLLHNGFGFCMPIVQALGLASLQCCHSCQVLGYNMPRLWVISEFLLSSNHNACSFGMVTGYFASLLIARRVSYGDKAGTNALVTMQMALFC